MKNRILSIMIALVMCFALLPAHALALSGSGAEPDPYVIASAADWNELAAFVAGGGDTTGNVYLQTADIVEPVTTMIGNEEHPFKGIYDGGGHTLNVNITGEGNTYFIAPFSAVENAQIKRLVVDGSVTGYYHTAGLAGRLSGTNEITDVLVKADITLTGAYGGGVIGHGVDSTATLEGVAFTGSVTGGENVGGIWGWSDSANVTMINCFENGSYTGSGVNPVGIGGSSGLDITNVIHTNGLYGGPRWDWGAVGDRGYVFSSTEDVTLYVYPGEYSYKYETSGIELHEGAMVWEGVYAVKKGTTVSLTAEYTGSDPDFSGIQADVGTLVGDGPDYTIVMPGSNVLIYVPGPGDVPYVDAAGEPHSPVPAKDVTGETVLFDGGWYAVAGEVTVSERINTSGDVNLILCDGATLTAQKGIGVPAGSSLTIWSQEGGSGALVSNGYGDFTAGIGGTGDGGTTGDITINGGVINATGRNSCGAGIGTAGNSGIQGTITINGGDITAYGQPGGAGIGGGTKSAAKSIVITGGTINSSSGTSNSGGGAAIGAGYSCDGGTIDISGGIINVTGGYACAGIGGGSYSNFGEITISGTDTVITAHGGEQATGIGGGNGSKVGKITITGGTITAISGEGNWDYYGGAGIGGGYGSDPVDITITGGVINAMGDCDGAGIGGGRGANAGNIMISGGDITASSLACAAGIGCGGYQVCGGSIEITGGVVRAAGNGGAAAIGGCDCTGNNAADPMTISISGGEVYAESTEKGAAIGTGKNANSGATVNINISGDAYVVATGCDGSAGIGGGNNSAGVNVNIEGGLITAIAGSGDGVEAIGHGTGQENSGTLTLCEDAAVFKAPRFENQTAGDGRYTACRGGWVRIATVQAAVPYVDESGNIQTCSLYTILTEKDTVLESGWYVIKNEKAAEDRLKTNGDVNFILTDGSTYNAVHGITVAEGNSLTIFGQTELFNVPGDEVQTVGTGALNASTSSTISAYHQFSAIGGEGRGTTGDVRIHGGVVVARGNWGAGIGGGDVPASSGSLMITGGYVEAYGGNGSAAIGGGAYGNGSVVNVSGGYVVAKGSAYFTSAHSTFGDTWQVTPAIGSGRPRLNGSEPRNSGSLTVTGGTVIAEAGPMPGPEDNVNTVFGAQAIGVNEQDAETNGDDRISIPHMRVYDAAGSTDPVRTEQRINACHGLYAKIEPCDHSYSVPYDEDVHWYECFWCEDETESFPHSFGQVYYDWGEDDHSECTAYRECTVCTYKQVETVATVSETIQDPTCGEEGATQYTAVFENPEFGTVTEVFFDPVRDPANCPGKIFTDMPKIGNWAHDPIDWAVETKVTSGMTKTTFGPALKITRGQVVTFLWRAAGSPAPTTTKTEFKDLKKDGFYYKAVLWAVENGITNGMTKTTFEPGGNCTRGQIVAFMYRYAGSPAVDTTSTKFVDLKKGAFYEKAVAWAVETGVTTGTSETTFSPAATCTRAQTVAFLYRLVKSLNK